MSKPTPARFFWEETKPQKWKVGDVPEDPAEDMTLACKRASYIVWANSREEAERMDKMSWEELQAYVKERDGEQP